ncbi:hypothetical protein [Bradyrhizobium canariense]|uniref:Uncharacterized protein n=1 Tax=Bradyrhizobium canariense TaxID=255045 RepID=A0A1H1NAI5_9BRAD|nr:hypothetical protein [Bradyrhizobium canariense]SDR95860.1 hypothetical protein SAMN05444158_0544 [Bradyrhizobium canariense]
MRAGLALAILIVTALPACASEGFNIVIPGRPGVPIIINGVDASYAVVEGEWGLGKGNPMQPTVYGGRPVEPEPPVGHYYPTLGRTPGYGRLEIDPPSNRTLPKPAESYHQSWSAQSAPPPKTQPEVPFYPPQVIVAPPNGGAGTMREPERQRGEPQPQPLERPRKLPK